MVLLYLHCTSGKATPSYHVLLEAICAQILNCAGTEPTSNEKHFFNGNFELINVTSNGTMVADATMIPNWIPGGAGVQIVQSSTYQMSNYEPGGGVFAIHLNNPTAIGNTTQGSLASHNFSWNPEPATLYTVQYDCARLPDGPVNIVPALKVSSMTGNAPSILMEYDHISATFNY